MAGEGGGGGGAGADAGSDSLEQLRLLGKALRGLPRELIASADSTEEKLIERGLAEAPAILGEVREEWNELKLAEARQAAASRVYVRVLGLMLIAVPDRQLGLRIAVVGLFFSLAIFIPVPDFLELRAVLALIATGFLVAFVPRLLNPLLRMIRLLGLADLRPQQAVLNASSRWFLALGRSIRILGLLLFVSTLGWLTDSEGVRQAVALATLIGLLLMGLPSALRALLGPLSTEGVIEGTRVEAAKQAFEERLRVRALGHLRLKLDEEAGLSYVTALSYGDTSGLGEMDDGNREVSTPAKERLLRMMRGMPGGTIGLSGSRGAGKTTLIRSLRTASATRVKREPPLTVVVDAPVHYDPREFVLYLFGRVCAEVVGPDAVRDLRGSDRPFGAPVPGPWTFLTNLRWLLGFGAVVAGVGLVASSFWDPGALNSPLIWGLALTALGFTSLTGQVLESRRRQTHLTGLVGTGATGGVDPLVQSAVLRLRQIWFQQSFSTGWSGGFKAPLGLEAGVNGSTDLAEQQLSLPDVVDLFREFLGHLALRREVRIGIDELDKMDDETARRFLNEIKVVFRIPDCFFLVSISEDAMSFFERRGLSIRDVFDSSFDEVLEVPHLEFNASRELLSRRVTDLPLPFRCLLHCLSGGLPRDLIRAARNLTDLEEDTPLKEAAAGLLERSLKAKVMGAKVVGRSFEYEEHRTLLMSWLERLQEADCHPQDLLLLCKGFESDLLEVLLRLPLEEEDVRAERREVQALGTQMVAFAYYAATTMEFFERFESESFVNEALEGQPSLVERLAIVTQTFGTDISFAWSMLTALRKDLGLEGGLAFPRHRLRAKSG